jgi:hypothetical protein
MLGTMHPHALYHAYASVRSAPLHKERPKTETLQTKALHTERLSLVMGTTNLHTSHLHNTCTTPAPHLHPRVPRMARMITHGSLQASRSPQPAPHGVRDPAAVPTAPTPAMQAGRQQIAMCTAAQADRTHDNLASARTGSQGTGSAGVGVSKQGAPAK